MSDEPLVLAVETSSRVGSVALALGPDLLEESQFSAPLQHSAEVFLAIEGLLTRHGRKPLEIAQIHLSTGPGSFTGLRIAVTLAKTMHLANRARIVTVDSLDVVAANLSDKVHGSPCQEKERRQTPVPETIASLFDAKRGQFYAAVYRRIGGGQNRPLEGLGEETGYRIPAPDNGFWHKIVPDCLLTAREIMDKYASRGRIGLLGDGLLYHRDKFNTDGVLVLAERYWSPRAAKVHLLGYQKARAGRFADPFTLTPFYLRGPEVTLRKYP